MSALPVSLIVILLNFTIAPIGSYLLWKFIIGSVFIIMGLTIFLFGVELGIQPIGSLMGETITKSKKIWIVILFGFILGFFINIAEPDLQVLARQVSNITSGVLSQISLVVVVSVGIGIMVALGLLRIVFSIPINKLLTVLYGIILLLAVFSSESFHGIAFDSGGATTGSMTVPFILALGLGVASFKGGTEAEEDSFGLVGIASTGPMIAVFTMSILSSIEKLTGVSSIQVGEERGILSSYIHEIPIVTYEVLMALLPFLILFILFNNLSFKLKRRQLRKIFLGLLYTFVCFILFLVGVNAGFMEAGRAIGQTIALIGKDWLVILTGFILGLTVILAEPAVYVLNEQIEDVTSGHIRKSLILFSLAVGVAVAVALSMIRILNPSVHLWHFLLPGYLLAILLTYFTPKLFVGIAFDSGGVASGPMTATFILAFSQGVAGAIPGADVLLDGFGVISMVALTPLIAIQILGILFERKAAKRS